MIGRIGKGKPYNIGNEYVSVEQFENALHNFVSAVQVFNTLRSLLRSEDGWKIYFHKLHDKTYTALRRLLIRIGKIDGSFCLLLNRDAPRLCLIICLLDKKLCRSYQLTHLTPGRLKDTSGETL